MVLSKEEVWAIFVSEIKEWNKTIKKFDKQVINAEICSKETILKLKAMMENVVKRGTAQGNYAVNGGSEKHYI